jgi:hypothetical protein
MGFIADQLPEDATELRAIFNDPNPILAYLTEIKNTMPGGANIVGTISARMKYFYRAAGMDLLADAVTYAPGSRTVNFGDEDTQVRTGLGAPIAYDVWYLAGAGNVLTFGDKDRSDSMDKMEHFFKSIDDAKPLKIPNGHTEPGIATGVSMGPVTSGGEEYVIKECHFEVYLTGNGVGNDSMGPETGNKNDLVGYVDVPIGPLGVMWRMSLATESSLAEGTGTNVFAVDGGNNTIQGGELLPPFDLQVRETCGEMLMNKGYLLDDDSTCELVLDDANEPPYLHKWLRYWIKKDNTTIRPGEFVGILCRPYPLHCWWHQETAPFVYAGNWLETEFYASGVVQEVIVEDAYAKAYDEEVGNRYKVWVKNEEILVKSTDFLEYEKDERVGILKTYREGDGGSSGGSVSAGGGSNGGGPGDTFTWEGLELQETEDELNREWVVVPVDFFGTGGNSVGG